MLVESLVVTKEPSEQISCPDGLPHVSYDPRPDPATAVDRTGKGSMEQAAEAKNADQFLPSLVRMWANMSSVMRERSHSGFQPHSSRAQVSSSELGQLSAISFFTGSMS